MEFGSIEREIHVDASPEIVFDVISSPEHIREWWNGAETDLSPMPGTVARSLGATEPAEPHIEHAHRRRGGAASVVLVPLGLRGSCTATATNSLLVTFELAPSGAGTTSGSPRRASARRAGSIAVLEAAYNDHVNGWDIFVPQPRRVCHPAGIVVMSVVVATTCGPPSGTPPGVA